MEFPLALSQRLQLGDPKQGNFSNLQGGINARITARQTTVFKIVASEKLVQDLKSHGFATCLEPHRATSHGLKLTLGFEDVSTRNLNNCYLSIEGMQELVNEVLGYQTWGRGKDVKIRFDIDHLQLIDKDFSMITSGRGYIFNMQPDENVDEKFFILRMQPLNYNYIGNWTRFFYSDWWPLPDMQWKMFFSLVIMLNSREEPKPCELDLMSVTRKMLTHEVLSDVSIIPGNGTEVKCHRSVLAAHSPVFERMFRTDMKEARTGIVEMPGMSEESTRAFVGYLYTWETTAAEENAVICIDLLKASDKYDIKPLETSMQQILLAKAEDWFTADAALQLVLHVKDTELEEVKKRAKELFKSKFNEVRQLTAFKQLFIKEMDTVKELVAYLAIY